MSNAAAGTGLCRSNSAEVPAQHKNIPLFVLHSTRQLRRGVKPNGERLLRRRAHFLTREMNLVHFTVIGVAARLTELM
jgi:hypothetical protein